MSALNDFDDSDDSDVFVYRDRPRYSHWSIDCDPYIEKTPLRRPALRSTVSDMPRPIKDMRKMRQYNTFYYNPPLLSTVHPVKKKNHCPYLFLFFFSFFLVLFVFLNLIPLDNVEVIAISNVLGTHKELIFNLHVRARNSNWWRVSMTTASFSVFASSHYVPTSANFSFFTLDPAEFLGSIYHLDDPLIYHPAAFFNATTTIATSLIQIQSPGTTKNDNSGNERWSLLIRYPYELTIRGVLTYKILPISQLHTVRVCKMARVDPYTGQISDVVPIPEKSICDDPLPIE